MSSNLSSPWRQLSPAIALLLSCVLYTLFSRESGAPELIRVKEGRERLTLTWDTGIIRICFGFAFGFLTLAFLATPQAFDGTLLFGISMLLCCLLQIAVLRITKKSNYPYELTLRVTFVCLALALLFVAESPMWLTTVVAIVSFIGFAFIDMSGWAALSVIVTKHRSQPVYQFLRGNTFFVGGLLLGWIYGTVTLGLSPLPIQLSLSQSCTFILAVLFIVMSVIPIGHDPLTMNLAHSAEPQTVANDSVTKVEITDSLREEACLAVAERCNLSPRQREVLILLSKGYSAAAIERELCISNATVRSHTYQVYGKTGVSSRQELIDLVDSELSHMNPKRSAS